MVGMWISAYWFLHPHISLQTTFLLLSAHPCSPRRAGVSGRVVWSEIWRNHKIRNCIRWHDNQFEVNWPPEPTLVLRWISKYFLFGALPSNTLKIKHTKKLKEIPSRHVPENLLEKSNHSCLYTSETHWQFTGILPIYNGRHAKSHNSRL